MSSLVEVFESGQGELAGNSVLGPSPVTGTLGFPGALADACVKATPQEWPLRPTRKIEIRTRSVELPEPFRRAVYRAIELLQLPRGWNSHGAEPVSGVAFVQTIEFLTAYVVHGVAGPTLVPTVRGGLQIEWHRRGVNIEVEVDPDGSVSWCAEDRETGEESEGALAGHEELIRTWLRRASD